MALARSPPSPLISVTVASSISEMQSQRMLPSGVHTSSARCPMANLGVVPMPIRPGSYWRNPLWCEIRRRSSVVHDCPSGGMCWRSSSHTGQCAGGASLGGYCVPQVEQMNAGMISPVWPPMGQWYGTCVNRGRYVRPDLAGVRSERRQIVESSPCPWVAEPFVQTDAAEARFAQRYERVLLDPAAPVSGLGVAYDLMRVADRLQIAGDDFIKWRAFRAGDIDDAVSRRLECHLRNNGSNVLRRDGLKQAGRVPDRVFICA